MDLLANIVHQGRIGSLDWSIALDMEGNEQILPVFQQKINSLELDGVLNMEG